MKPAAVEDDADAAFFDAITPDLITIMLGTNDMHNDGRVHVYRQNLTRMIRKLQTHSPGTGIPVIACPEAGQTGAGVAARFRDAAVPGGAPTFSRMFATRGDAGVFRDATLSARVTIAP